jgi:CO/xanthine dehydrogenase Mo-binding subunit
MWYGIGNTALSNPSTIRIGLSTRGILTLYNGAVDIGQGSNTTLTQIAADAVGLPMSQFTLVMGDTDRTADAGKTSASRQAFVSGKAAELAGLDLRRKLFAAGAHRRRWLDRTYALALEGLRSSVRQDGITHRVRIDREIVGEGFFDPPTTPADQNGQGHAVRDVCVRRAGRGRRSRPRARHDEGACICSRARCRPRDQSDPGRRARSTAERSRAWGWR